VPETHFSRPLVQRLAEQKLREPGPARQQARQTKKSAGSLAARPMRQPTKTCASMPTALVAAMERPLAHCRLSPAA